MAEPENSGTGNLFLQMVLTLQTSAMQHLGKIASPFSGEVNRDLLSAKAAVDMLLMLREKTKGNLNGAEAKVLDHVVYELQMNYVDEAGKPDVPEAPASGADGEGKAGSAESGEATPGPEEDKESEPM